MQKYQQNQQTDDEAVVPRTDMKLKSFVSEDDGSFSMGIISNQY